ncbi:hypothetical protein [Vulcaniibacterium tengchongense]|uniref:Uncharacterized protein n=1 Tax=Vulcaniibacterium tengchongense TaxID=1273429 RepID=A0A3N4VF09_9GAMM|nr:hypothetical protein [Vulcaniibacterium tengchongense]RPE80095.1 hypothetical protein EDC50_1927 [Vulcaniibacterium tengchongense]
MNLFKSLLFLHGHIVHPELFEDTAPAAAEADAAAAPAPRREPRAPAPAERDCTAGCA